MEGRNGHPESGQSALQWCADECTGRGWRLAWSLLRNNEDALDAVQQAFLVAAGKPDKIPQDNPWPWFATVIALQARNVRRKFQRGEASLHAGEITVADSRSQDPAMHAADLELARNVDLAVAELPPDEREALVLTQLGGMTYKQAAEALDIPLGTLNHRVSRALAGLRQRLKASDARILGCVPFLPVDGPPAELKVFIDTQFAAAASGASVPATLALTGIAMKKILIAAALCLVALLVLLGVVVSDVFKNEPGGHTPTSDVMALDGADGTEGGRPDQRGGGSDPRGDHASDAPDRRTGDATEADGTRDTPNASDGIPRDQDGRSPDDPGQEAAPRDSEPATLVELPDLDDRAFRVIGEDTPWHMPEAFHQILVGPDDAYLLVVGRSFVQRVNAFTGTNEWRMTFDSGTGVNQVALSPDGLYVAVATNRLKLLVLHAGVDITGNRVARRHEVRGSATSVAFSPDGRRLAVGYMSDVDILHAETGELEETCRFGAHSMAYEEGVRAVGFTPDGGRVVAVKLGASLDSNGIRVFDAASGDVVLDHPTGHSGVVYGENAVISADGTFVIIEGSDAATFVMTFDEFLGRNPVMTGDDDEANRLFKQRRAEYRKYLQDKGVDDKLYLDSVYHTDPPRTRGVWKVGLQVDAPPQRITLPAEAAKAQVGLSHDASTLAVWDGRHAHTFMSGNWTRMASIPLDGYYAAVALGRDGRVLYCGDGFEVRRHNTADGTAIRNLDGQSLRPDGKSMSLSRDGGLVVFSDADGMVAYDIGPGAMRWRRDGLRPAEGANSFNAQGSIYAATSDALVLLNPLDGEVARVLEWPDGLSFTRWFSVSADGNTVAVNTSKAGSELDTEVVLWRAGDDYKPEHFSLPESAVSRGITGIMLGRLALSPDGRLGACMCWHGYMEWDFEAKTQRIITTQRGFMNNSALVFSDDGTALLAIGLPTKKGFLHVDLKTGASREVAIEGPDAEHVSAVARGPGGGTVLVGVYSGEHDVPWVLLVDTATGQTRDKFYRHNSPIKAISVNLDGTVMATLGSDGVLCVWRLTP